MGFGSRRVCGREATRDTHMGGLVRGAGLAARLGQTRADALNPLVATRGPPGVACVARAGCVG